MRRRRAAVALAVTACLASTACSSGADEAALLAARPFSVHVPPTYSSDEPAPLLILLHGYGVTGELESAYLHLGDVVDAHGIISVAPDGTANDAGKQFWNASDSCCAPPNSDVDDSAYVRAIIGKVTSQYEVDRKRIFIVGHSNGGFMAYRMACDHADVVAAVVSLEGAMMSDPSACAPSEPVAVLEVHGTADVIIDYDGGRGDPALPGYPSAGDSVMAWAKFDGCRTTPDDPPPAGQTIEQGRPPATVTSYSSGCRPGGHAELWTVPGGTHIPTLSDTFTEQIVAFLLAHPKP